MTISEASKQKAIAELNEPSNIDEVLTSARERVIELIGGIYAGVFHLSTVLLINRAALQNCNYDDFIHFKIVKRHLFPRLALFIFVSPHRTRAPSMMFLAKIYCLLSQ